MNRFFSFTAALALIFAAVSCQKEGLQADPAVEGELVEVTLSIGLPTDMATKASTISDGSMAADLYYELYRGNNGAANDGTLIPSFAVGNNAPVKFVLENEGYVARLTLTLVKNYKYDIAFWAMNTESKVYAFDASEGLRKISVSYKDDANSEDRDAFTAVVKDYVANLDQNKTILLHRPFAQVNFLTTDYALVQELGITDMTSKVHFKGLADTFDALNQVATGSVESDFALDVIPVRDGHVHPGYPADTHAWVSMNYILTAHELEDVTDHTSSKKDMFRDPLTATFEHATGSIAIEVPNVPYQRNWRTNIIGNLFTEKVVANVLIVPVYEDDHNLDETGKPIQ